MTSPPQPPASQRKTNNSQPTSSAAPANAASPPSKRDLKSWWKGFKVPSKQQEQAGSAHLSITPTFTPAFTPAFTPVPFLPSSAPARKEYATLFAEDIKGFYGSQPAALLLLQEIVAEERNHPANVASAGADSSRGIAAAGGRARRRCRSKWGYLGIFGVPLRQSITYANVAISLMENGQSYIYGYVPIVVAKCGVFLKDKATEVEGIFRLAGSEKRIKELKTMFDSPDKYGKGLVWDGYTVHDAANVLRRYLNDLPEPVVPLDLYEKFRAPLKGATKQAVGDAEGPQFSETFDLDAAILQYQKLITELPPLNRQLLLYILDLLAVFAAKADQNRMNSQNLAAIFQPGMLSHPNHAMAPDEYRLNQCVIIFLIENQDHFIMDASTAADERTVHAVQTGTPLINEPAASPAIINVREGVTRSASNASAGAESVAKEGQIRRNKSASSRRSRQSAGGAHSPGSPALATTPTGGLTRSNTVPSKRSPALGSGKFTPRHESSGTPVAPLTPVSPSPPGAAVQAPHAPAVVEQLASLTGNAMLSSTSTGFGTLASTNDQAAAVGRSQDRLLDPSSAEVSTPSKERRIPSLFQRAPSGENNEVRQPNKLRKKKLPGSANPSAQSSSASLPHSATQSPGVEGPNPLEETLAPPPAAAAADVRGRKERQAGETPLDSTPRATQIPHPAVSHPHHGEASLRPTISPPTSLHSSFNDGSDIDQVDELIHAGDTGTDSSEKERKKRWRISRRKEDLHSESMPALGDSPKKPIGLNSHADMSSSTVESAANKAQRSFTGDSSDPTIASTDAAMMTEGRDGGRDGRDGRDGKEDPKGLTGWIKNKYREHKEIVEQKRNKSPPGERTASIGGNLQPTTRGKSLDLNRASDEKLPHPQ